ncbi:LysR family transcriptional regulator [uncultured Pseudoramibacter sp.]|uniref:LysR family transcriptional regulator n=1 Tax=uncultured Pseudoramibacter sp. TaxID=1623493 RepID=UPI0025F9D856|nr:LysR family transcriptional regulator [uncultured Pseudoramibacter sp.]
MDNRKFEYFLTVYELGNITKAAQKNFISQPSMTQYINRLEESIGARLFDRSTSPLTLTKAGEIYLDYVQKSMELEKQFERAIDSLKNDIDGVIKLGVPLQMQSFLLPKLVSPFMRENKHINFNIKDDASPTLEKQLIDYLIDCALIYINDQKRYRTLEYIQLKDENIYLICHKDHPLVRGRANSPEHPVAVSRDDIRDERFCLLSKAFIVRQMSDEFFMREQFIPENIISMTSMHAILNTITINPDLAFIPEYMIKSFPQKDELAYLQVDGIDALPMHLAIAYLKGRTMSNATEAFIQYVKAYYQVENT